MSEILVDPITFELFDKPIITLCCNNTISKEIYREWVNRNGTCPFCRQYCNISEIDRLPRNRVIESMIEEKSEEEKQEIKRMHKQERERLNKIAENKWKAKLTPMYQDIQTKNLTGQLEIYNRNNEKFSTLLVPVIDVSGSMGGSPIEQVRFSMTQFVELFHKHNHIVSKIITYNSRANIIDLSRSKTVDNNIAMVSEYSRRWNNFICVCI